VYFPSTHEITSGFDIHKDDSRSSARPRTHTEPIVLPIGGMI
jgi:hypothetical protein